MAMKVVSSRTPLPQESSSAGSNSGRRPYFEGPKTAAWVLARKITVKARNGLPCQKADSKEIANEEDAEVLFRFAGILAEDEVDDEKLQAIVVEGALELGGDEA